VLGNSFQMSSAPSSKLATPCEEHIDITFVKFDRVLKRFLLFLKGFFHTPRAIASVIE
jgi:hypothetical protein